MSSAAADLIPPALRARLRDLELRSRRGGAAPGLGTHASRLRGSGLEFAQHRPYAPGDMPRQIDWQLYARSDRLYVREAERDSALDVWLLLDGSASMNQRGVATLQHAQHTRLDVAITLAAAVMELAWRQGDTLGMAVLGHDRASISPAAAGSSMRDHVQLKLQALRASGAGGIWPRAELLAPLYPLIVQQSLVLLLSDCFDEGVVTLAQRLAQAGREVRVLQLLTVDERDFRLTGGHLLFDPETGTELLTDAPAARHDYLQRFAAAQTMLAQRLRGAGIGFASMVMDQPLLPALSWLVDPLARRVVRS